MSAFTMPFPAELISANSRDHWRTNARKVKEWRRLACYSGMAFRFLEIPSPATVSICVDVPDRRRRDPANLYPTLKAIIDGLVDARWWPDDTPEYVTTIEPTFRVVGRGAVRTVSVLIAERT